MDTPIAYLETTLTLDDGRRVRRFRQLADATEAEREARHAHELTPTATIRVWGEPGRCTLKLGPPDGSTP